MSTPTVFVGVEHGHAIVDEEIFGPVIAALPFDDIDDLAAKGQRQRYGLVAAHSVRDHGAPVGDGGASV